MKDKKRKEQTNNNKKNNTVLKNGTKRNEKQDMTKKEI